MERVLLFVVFLLLPFKFSLIVALLYLAYRFFFIGISPRGPNPFENDDRKKRSDYVTDHRARDKVLKQGFAIAKVPENLDAVVIGSGIGGLSTAAVLSKAGKKVLVLEQHDQAGGCCHTYSDKGYEFDVGIHYVGRMKAGSLDRVICDQISEGQLEWASLGEEGEEYDVVTIGQDDKTTKRYPILRGRDHCKRRMEEMFPDEQSAIDEYFRLLDNHSGMGMATGVLKLVPRKLAWLIVKSGLIHFFTGLWRGRFRKTTLEVVKALTSNRDLQTVFCYCWGDYGTPPEKSQFSTQASLCNYFMSGGSFYPVGGASEIAFTIIPVIERSGGKVMVRAKVDLIIMDAAGKAVGVKVNGEHEIRAPIIISNSGVYNTFQRLLPPSVARKSYYHEIASSSSGLKPSSIAGMSVFIGLNASNKELGLHKYNTWAFASNDAALTPGSANDNSLYSKSLEEVLDDKTSDPPLAFYAFPSAKDPNWTLGRPEREGKSTCTIVSFASWDWFKKFAGTKLGKRGEEYEEIKSVLGHRLLESVIKAVPQLKGHIDYVEIGSPVTNNYYLEQAHGEIYGLDHTLDRFDPWMTARLRPETDVPGLYLTGQDVMMCGFAGALYGGILCSGSVLGRNVIGDLQGLAKKLKEEWKEKNGKTKKED